MPAATCSGATRHADIVPGAAPTDGLDLVVDVSRLGHPQARAIAEDVGVPLVVPRLPASPAGTSEPSEAVARGTRAGRAVTLPRGATRPAVRPSTRRGDSTGPVARST